MPRTTFGGVLRSQAGGQRSQVSAAVFDMILPFHFNPVTAVTSVATYSASNTREVILPPNAIVTEIHFVGGATGGSSPTVDMGWVGVTTPASVNTDGLIDNLAAGANAAVTVATATRGAEFGAVMQAGQAVKITGGVGASAATGGAITGHIKFHVADDGSEVD